MHESARARVCVCEGNMALDKRKIVAVINYADSSINKEFLLSTSEGRRIIKSHDTINALFITSDGESQVVASDLSTRTIESKLNDKFYLNI